MTKYKTEKRKAEVGERILITDDKNREHLYKNGDVFTVTEAKSQGVLIGTLNGISHRRYEVIVGEHTPAPILDEMGYGEIIALVEDAMKALRTRQLQGRFDAQMEAVDKLTTNKSDQQRRDVIVARAKVDIEALYATDLGYRHDFIVNAEKRTVVALRKSFAEGYIRDRGIAKCAPTDCFNAHIGKAIALRRALRLPVPVEYLNVPQPTEVRDGDYVARNGGSDRMFVSSEDRFPPYDRPFIGLGFVNRHSDMFKIIDDSRTGEGE